MIRFSRILLLFVISCCFLFFVSCSDNIQNSISDQPDKIELVSVWQYLKAYSIYQDSNLIPSDPLKYESPFDLFARLNDTLHNVPYTWYINEDDYTINPFMTVPTGFASETDNSSNLVSFDSLTDSCCYLKISSFMDAPKLGAYVLDQYKPVLSKIGRFSKIIFDVRHNGGGDLTIMDSIIYDILPAGKKFIHAKERIYDSLTRTYNTVEHDWQTGDNLQKSEFVNKKIAVLIDSGSASASEIFALAMKDGAGALLIGEKSFGKGIGQIKIVRRNRPIIRITYAHFYRVTDKSDYHRKGIFPDSVSSNLKTDKNLAGVSDTFVFYAVKSLQPSASKIHYPKLSKAAVNSNLGKSGLFKVVDESEMK